MKKTLATTLLLTIFLSACGSEPENKMSDAEAKKFFTSLISVAVIGLFSVFMHLLKYFPRLSKRRT